MTIEANDLLDIVKATRMAKGLSKEMRKLLVANHGVTIADEISWRLLGALIGISGEEHGPEDGFDDYAVCKMAESNLSDEKMMIELWKMHTANTSTDAKKTRTTPEGEWAGTSQSAENQKLKAMLSEAAHEICFRCEKYRNADLGACHGCKWLAVKKGDY